MDASESADLTTHVILLRGVMPTGKNRVPMAPLRAALTSAGLGHVRTYIQSGNVVATSDRGQSAVEELVQSVVRESFGGDITVVARSAQQFRRILDRNPFAEADAARLYFSVLAEAPSPELLSTFLAAMWEPDEVRLIEDVVYTRYPTKHSDSKFNNNFFERKLKVAVTTRNFNTMTALVKLSST